MAATAGEEETARDGAPPCLTVQQDGWDATNLQVGNDYDCTVRAFRNRGMIIMISHCGCLCHPGNLLPFQVQLTGHEVVGLKAEVSYEFSVKGSV